MLLNILYYLNLLVQALLYTYFLKIFIKYIALTEYSNKKYILLFFSLLIFTIISKFLLFPFNALIFIIMLLLLLYYIFKIPLAKSLYASLILIILITISELINAYLTILLFKIPVSSISYSLKYKVIFSYTCFIILSIIIYITNLIIKKHETIKTYIKDIKSKHIKIFLMISGLCIFPQIIIFTLNKFNYPPKLLIINSIQIVILCIFIFIFTKNYMEEEKSKIEIQTLELQNKIMSNMVDGTRVLKHDFNNIIQALNGYVTTKQYDKLESYVNSLMKECSNLNSLSAITTEIFNDPAIYGIVGSKYYIANEQNIAFETDVTININNINFPLPELSRILGILLDNAIEATSKTSNKYVRLEMKYNERKNADIIRVINTYDTSINIDVNKIYEKGFSTKKVKSGIGLWEVSCIIKKHPNSQMFAEIENNKFIQNISIEK